MALHLVNSNDDFQIYGPVIMNSEIIAHKEILDNIHRIGIGHKREHLHKLVKESYTQVNEIVQMSQISLPYSLEGGQIDGAVLDITKAALLSEFKFAPISKDDYISYILVVRKDIVDTSAFKDFLSVYNEAVESLNNTEILKRHIDMPDEFWNDIRIKFLNLE